MVLEQFSLAGKVAVVTGSGSGIGQGIAVGLAEAGADIVAVYHSGIDTTCQQIEALGRRCLPVQADVSNMDCIDQIVNAALEAFGHIDILVNCAGRIFRQPALEHCEEEWDKVLAINTKVPFYLSQRVANQMIEKGIPGKIINIASMMSFFGGFNVASYTASKSAIRGITQSMSNEWSKYGIRVNALAPGWIATKMTKAVREDEGRNVDTLARIPAGRWGTPEDFKGPAVFLASSASDYISGYTIAVDGGFMGR